MHLVSYLRFSISSFLTFDLTVSMERSGEESLGMRERLMFWTVSQVHLAVPDLCREMFMRELHGI